MNFSSKVAILGIAVIALAAVPAMADTYSLTDDHCSGGCNIGSSGGTVTVTQSAGQLALNEVQIAVALNSPLEFISTGLNDTFDFNIAGTPTIALISSTNSNFTLASTTAGSLHFDGFGSFEYALTIPGNGAPSAQPGTETFVISCGAGCTPASFATFMNGGKQITSAYFGADVFSNNLNGATGNGNTGPIGADCLVAADCTVSQAPPPPSVPEPSSVLLLGTAGLGIVMVMKRRFGSTKQL